MLRKIKTVNMNNKLTLPYVKALLALIDKKANKLSDDDLMKPEIQTSLKQALNLFKDIEEITENK